MATYAAYKHVELYNVGSGKRRVLKPPGGGSSDIFQTTSDAATPRSIKNHMKSNIFAAPSPIRGSTTGEQRRHAQADSHNRLFGESDRAGATPAKTRQPKSGIPIGGDEADSSLKHSNGTNGHVNSSREHINGSENGKSCDYNENYRHSTDYLDSSSKFYGIDVSLCKPREINYSNPTYNSNVNLCIADDYIQPVVAMNNRRNPSGFRQKRESKFFFDENMNFATPLIGNAHETKICRKTLNGSLPTDGNSSNGEIVKPSGENIAPLNHVVNKNRIPPGGFSSGLW